MLRIFKLVVFVIGLLWVGTTTAQASGTFSSNGTVGTGSPTDAEPHTWIKPPGDPGAYTITLVKKNGGVCVEHLDFEYIDNGTSEGKVRFTTPLGPGDTVDLSGTTSNNGTHSSGVSFA